MKRLLGVVIAALLLISPVSAASLTKSVTFAWEHVATDYPLISSWTLYWADSEAGPWVKAMDIDHPDSNPLTQATGELTVTGAAGATVTKYFRMTAWSRTSGTETGPSNVATAAFKIPQVEPGAPSVLTITVNVIPQ